MPDSWLARRSRSEAASTYRASDSVSRPRNSTIRSLAAAITTPPVAATSMSAYTSGASVPLRCSSSAVTSATSRVAAQMVMVRNWVRVSNASARLSNVLGPLSAISSHWKAASAPATIAVSTVKPA